MGTGFGEAVEGYQGLAEWWIDKWGTHVSTIAQKVDAGTYTPNDGVADLSACVSLAAESLFLLVNEAFDAAKILSGEQDEPNWADTIPFDTTRPPTTATVNRVLMMGGPLVAVIGTDTIPASRVTFVPPSLGPNDTTFTMHVDGTGYDGVTYLGNVLVVDGGTGVLLETVSVWVLVA